MDGIDRQLLALLVQDGRATYHELGRTVRLSGNTVADRVGRLRRTGVLRRYGAELDLAALGFGMEMLSDIRLQDGVDRVAFEHGLSDIPHVTGAWRVTGEYDYLLRIVCADAHGFETISDRLKSHHGVRHVRSRLTLHEVPLAPERILTTAD